MNIISTSTLKQIITEELRSTQGVKTRKVIVEKYTEKQKRTLLADALADMVIQKAIKEMGTDFL
jgi:hypothetical protein